MSPHSPCPPRSPFFSPAAISQLHHLRVRSLASFQTAVAIYIYYVRLSLAAREVGTTCAQLVG